MTSRTHSASRIIIAKPRAVFRAFFDPEVIVKWRPPAGMDARLLDFDPRPGGGYRMELFHRDAATPGKSTPSSDIVRARFVELMPDEKIIESIEFENARPDFHGTMTLTTNLTPVNSGTKVGFIAENVPDGIGEDEHRAGMESSLRNLALLLE